MTSSDTKDNINKKIKKKSLEKMKTIDQEKKMNENTTESSSSDNDDSENEGEQVRVTFCLSSECTDTTLKVPTEPIAVPSDIERKGLQAVINHLLDRKISYSNNINDKSDSDDEDDDRLPPIPFDFIVCNNEFEYTLNNKNHKLLRTGVEREARKNGISLEHPITILYFPSNDIPEQINTSEALPDWIGCLSYNHDNNTSIITSGCYDGNIHIFKHDQKEQQQKDDNNIGLEKVASITGIHNGPIKCLSTANVDNNNKMCIVSGAMDHHLMIHQYNYITNDIKHIVKCIDGHNSSINSIDILQNNNNKLTIASGDWDGGLCIWNIQNDILLDNNDDDDEHISKKTKTNQLRSSNNNDKSIIKSLSPIISIQAHGSNISGISWGNYEKRNHNEQLQNQLITSSWDHSIKVWDIENKDCIITLNGSRVITCLDTSYYTPNVVVTGHSDYMIRLWDTRSNTTATTTTNNNIIQQVVTDNIFRTSHKGWITQVKWCIDNPYHISSTSHDGTIKIWDIRSSLPLHTMKTFQKTTKQENKDNQKVLSLVYGNTGMIYAGGTDCQIYQYRYNK